MKTLQFPRSRSLKCRSGLLALAATALMFGPSYAQNLITNPGFENGTVGWYSGGTLTIITTPSLEHNGTACGSVTVGAYASIIGQDVLGVLQPGHTYNWSAWLRTPSASPSVMLWISQTDASGSSSTLLSTVTIPANSWTLYSGSFTLNVSGTLSALSFWMQADRFGLTLYLDDISITDTAPAGVTGQGAAEFALESPWPNPARGDRLAVSFSLPTSEPARMELLDVGGRRVADREVGMLGAGQHTVTFDNARPLPAGLYFVRLQQGPNARTIRVAVLD